MNRANFMFDCVGAIDRASSTSAVMAELARSGANFGLDRFCVAGIPAPDKQFRRYVLVHNWPRGWLDRYTQGHYLRCDPVIRQLRSSTRPFTWSEAHYDPTREPDAHKVMTEATEFGLSSGFCVPIYTQSGDQAGVSFGGSDMELSAHNRPALHLIAIYAHSKAVELLNHTSKDRGRLPKLTPRELEVLQWSAAGKTTRDIGEILSISENTVETHCANACRKLDAVTRTQAVAEAIRARLIP